MKNNKSLIIAGESLKAKIGYINKEIARLEGIQIAKKTGVLNLILNQ